MNAAPSAGNGRGFCTARADCGVPLLFFLHIYCDIILIERSKQQVYEKCV